MPDDQIVKLLEEIRDLHKEHLQAYRQAVNNQDESIRMQRSAIKRSKVVQLLFGVLVIAFVVWLVAVANIR